MTQTATNVHHARARLLDKSDAQVTLGFPETSYQVTLKTYQPVSTPIGKRVVGVIRVQGRRIDLVRTGGAYLEPVQGKPRRLQGEVLTIDTSGQTITVHVGAAPVVCKMPHGQRADSFKPGDFVAFDVLEGASFSAI